MVDTATHSKQVRIKSCMKRINTRRYSQRIKHTRALSRQTQELGPVKFLALYVVPIINYKSFSRIISRILRVILTNSEVTLPFIVLFCHSLLRLGRLARDTIDNCVGCHRARSLERYKADF